MNSKMRKTQLLKTESKTKTKTKMNSANNKSRNRILELEVTWRVISRKGEEGG